MMTVQELIDRLSELPTGWQIYATKSGDSLQVWDPEGAEYGFVFTDGRQTKMLTDRRRHRQLQMEGGK